MLVLTFWHICHHVNVQLTYSVGDFLKTLQDLQLHRVDQKQQNFTVHSVFPQILIYVAWNIMINHTLYQLWSPTTCVYCTSCPGWCWLATDARQPHTGPSRWIGLCQTSQIQLLNSLFRQLQLLNHLNAVKMQRGSLKLLVNIINS